MAELSAVGYTSRFRPAQVLPGGGDERMIAKWIFDEVEERRRAMPRGMDRGRDEEIVEKTERAPHRTSAGEH
ncbi:MAG: hypothetical protein A2138_15905 [Deltaproteobacteria bacterium RBG_16_71_12]|nr:MAG: hypothetical protein A2138_15905 [Deltaproteobacteria bacterium RBG_16_71_12]